MRKSLVLISILLLSSCSMMRSVGVKVVAGGISDSSKDIQKETDWNYFEKSIPGNLKLMETMLSMSPGNQQLLTALIQGFAGYALAIHETRYLEHQLKDVENSPHLSAAISYYSKALYYGEQYLLGIGIDRAKMIKLIRDEAKLQDYLSSNLSESDFKAVFYTAQAWGSLINLQRTNMILMSQLPAVKGMFDFVCTKKPNFEQGACDLFYASYEVGRPKMLGGNPEKGKKIFKQAMEKNPLNLLTNIMYMQLVTIPQADEKEYDEMESKLEDEFEEFLKLNNAGADSPSQNKFNNAPYVKLFNAIAHQRFLIIKKLKKEIF